MMTDPVRDERHVCPYVDGCDVLGGDSPCEYHRGYLDGFRTGLSYASGQLNAADSALRSAHNMGR